MTERVIVKFKGPNAPKYQTSGSAGCDIVANEDVCVPSGEWMPISTGLFIEMPDGYEGQIRSRSGLALKNGVFVLNSPGTIDSDYRGEIKVILANIRSASFSVKKGDRIAQLVIAPVIQATFKCQEELSETARGAGGFGSTGA